MIQPIHRRLFLLGGSSGYGLGDQIWRCGFVLILVAATGCQNRFNLSPPGTIGEQRARAQLYDPYPDNDLGPPIVGGRPLGFDRPSAQPRRLQQDNPFAKKKSGSAFGSPAPIVPPVTPVPFGGF